MSKLKFRVGVCAIGFLISCGSSNKKKVDEPQVKYPNIILILADDMGYGDPKCYNENSKIPTPHIDQLAKEGMLFTDAHTNSSVCTPTRYGIITGQYAWRSSLKKGVTWSYDSLIITKQTKTIASLLKKNGYQTAAIGKWHLGLGWQKEKDSVLFDKPLTAGPTDLGFDYYYGIAASLDIAPYVYIENNKVTELPTHYSEGGSKVYKDDYWRKGLAAPNFDHYKVLDNLTEHAEKTITDFSKKKEPFFLYLPLTAPHTPWIPKDGFKGKSQAGNYGDLAAEVDGVVGRIEALVKRLHIDENTIIIFTSDNGSALKSEEMQTFQHFANGAWRGRKGDIYEGGNRVPFIVKWPGKIQKGTVSNQLISTTDFYATFADLIDVYLDQGKGSNRKDSQSFLPALLQENPKDSMRTSMVYHSVVGMFALRDKDMVFVKGKGSGGFIEVPDTTQVKNPFQLYNLNKNPEQLLISKNKELEQKLLKKLDSIIR
ncbi:sulfatase family protein [Mariniflexile sp.]|uniref:sulfatase family protein n=1 Tax=Mariniflexile sp. TaxID=1979402 RepID=UPI004048D84B